MSSDDRLPPICNSWTWWTTLTVSLDACEPTSELDRSLFLYLLPPFLRVRVRVECLLRPDLRHSTLERDVPTSIISYHTLIRTHKVVQRSRLSHPAAGCNRSAFPSLSSLSQSLRLPHVTFAGIGHETYLLPFSLDQFYWTLVGRQIHPFIRPKASGPTSTSPTPFRTSRLSELSCFDSSEAFTSSSKFLVTPRSV